MHSLKLHYNKHHIFNQFPVDSEEQHCQGAKCSDCHHCSEISDTLSFSMTAVSSSPYSSSRSEQQQASNSSDCKHLRQLDRLRGLALSTGSHNLTAWRARNLITQMCTSKFIWIPELHARWLPHSYIRVMSNTKTGCKITTLLWCLMQFLVFAVQRKT